MTAKAKAKIPAFRSDAEERAFWSEHSVEEFANQLKELDVVIRPARSEQIAVRLYKADLDALRTLAAEKGVGHTTLARAVIEQWLHRPRPKATAPRAKRRAARR
jgi:hypothetical protein